MSTVIDTSENTTTGQRSAKRLSRRELLTASLAGGIGLSIYASQVAAAVEGQTQGRTAAEIARDEEFWLGISRAYNLDGQHIVLNGGGNNPIPNSVVDAMHRFDEMAASQPRPHNYVLWNRMYDHRVRLAQLFNCQSEELAITRNTTEGLNIVCSGLELNQGDEVILSNFDISYVLPIVEQLAERKGVSVRVVDLPLSPTTEQVVSLYRNAINSRTKLVIASHVVDGWGFVLPVKELAALAHENNAQMLVDGALGFGQIPVDVEDIGCDYYATSLHKWLNAPLGTGALFVKKDRIESLWPMYGNTRAKDDITKFEQIGTRCGPTLAAIGQAIDLYQQIGPERKAERVKYLTSRVIEALRDTSRVHVFTEVDEAKRTGLARVAVEGISGRDLTRILIDDHRIFTYGNFPGEYDGVYISPNVFNSVSDMEHFIASIREIAAA